MMSEKPPFWLAGLQVRKSLSTLSLCCRPIILDPADPTHNVAEGYRWDIVAERARQCLKQDCCYDSQGNPVSGWNVKVMAPLQAAARGWKPRIRLTHSVYLFISALLEPAGHPSQAVWGLAAPPAKLWELGEMIRLSEPHIYVQILVLLSFLLPIPTR